MSYEAECDICRKKYHFSNKSPGDVVQCHVCGADFEIPTEIWMATVASKESNDDSGGSLAVILPAVGGALFLLFFCYCGLEFYRAVTAKPKSDSNLAMNVPQPGHMMPPQLQNVAPNVPANIPNINNANQVAPTPFVAPAAQALSHPQLAPYFHRSKQLPTHIDSIVPSNSTINGTSPIIIRGKGLSRIQRAFTISAGREALPLSYTGTDEELRVERVGIGFNQLIVAEVPDGSLLTIPSYTAELNSEPSANRAPVKFAPPNQPQSMLSSTQFVLMLPGSVLTTQYPNVNCLLIKLKGSRLLLDPNDNLTHTIYVGDDDKVELNLKPRTEFKAINLRAPIHLCEVPALLEDAYNFNYSFRPK